MSRFAEKPKESSKQESLGNSLAWIPWLLQRRRQVMAMELGGEVMLSIRKWKTPGASVTEK